MHSTRFEAPKKRGRHVSNLLAPFLFDSEEPSLLTTAAKVGKISLDLPPCFVYFNSQDRNQSPDN
ncbi:MAG: hypothetical protein DRQ02_03220 [Candidatus Latescibacterota bacterium]|nr:MAG: hypothetical protein DRQ02_03220 [Candidatus Latescibacterota bacterium]RKY69961.1 MAG: hypothetical protein DRQ24_10040 [Candidatus Latescibacterota bacterium]